MGILCTVEFELLYEMVLEINFANLVIWDRVINDLIIARVISIGKLNNRRTFYSKHLSDLV